MDILDREVLKDLASTTAAPCVSIFMPSQRVEAEQPQNIIRFKNLLREVRKQATERGMKAAEVDDLLQPATDLQDDATYWRSMSDGFCAFLTPDSYEFYRLPVDFGETAIVADHFYLKPLFPLIASNNRFFVLALSQNTVRLFMGTHYGLDQVEEAKIPEGIAEALAYDDPEQQLQVRSHRTGGDGGVGGESIYHGQGSGEQEFKSKPQTRLKRYFREIDASIQDILQNETAPLVLAGVEYYLPIYREVNSYPHFLSDQIVAGNPDQLTAHELHQKVWSVMEPHFTEAQTEAITQFQNHFEQGNGRASASVEDVVKSAAFGRVDTLFTPVDEVIWGAFDDEAGSVTLHGARQQESVELLNLAAMHTFTNGGTVHALKRENMPVDEPVAATYRYAADLSAA